MNTIFFLEIYNLNYKNDRLKYDDTLLKIIHYNIPIIEQRVYEDENIAIILFEM